MIVVVVLPIPFLKTNIFDIFNRSSIVAPLFSAGGLNVQPNFQKERLDRTSTLRWGCWKRGSNFFQGGLQFLQKNKLKSEIFKGCVRYIFASSFLSVKESTCETKKNVFYFTSEALLVLQKINF